MSLFDLFRKKPVPGDWVEVKNQYNPSGPALVIDKSTDMDHGFGNKVYPRYLCQFEDETIAWYSLSSFVGW